MLDLTPRRWLPRHWSRGRRIDLAYLVTALTCLGGGVVVAAIGKWWPGLIEWYAGAGQLIELVHSPWALCPFCGGSRALLACCRGDFGAACSLSLVGVTVFAFMLGSLPLRLIGVLRPGIRGAEGLTAALLARLDSSRFQLSVMLCAWFLQVAAHFAGLLTWVPAEALRSL